MIRIALLISLLLLPSSLLAKDDAKAQLLYVAAAGGNTDIFLAVGDEEPRNLTSNAAADLFPAWSPDGSRIAFTSNRDGGVFNVYVMNAAGGEVAKVTDVTARDNATCLCPSWSPDGEALCYQRRAGNLSQLFTIDMEAGRVRLLGDNAWDPAWSPRGDKIVFCGLGEKGWSVFTIEPDGAKRTEIVTSDNQAGMVYPAWSPDGKKIAFTKPVAGVFDLRVCDLDGQQEAALTKIGAMASHATWSADGKHVYYYRKVDDTHWQWERVDVATGKSEPFKDWKPEPYIQGARLSWWQGR